MSFARRLGLAGCALALGATFFLAWIAVAHLAVLAEEHAQVRSQRVAEGLALRVQRAVALGIPMDALAGVDAMFRQRLRESPDIEALALVDRDGRQLALHARDGGTVLPGGDLVAATVRTGDRVVGRLLLVRSEAGELPLLRQWGPLLAACVLLLAALAHEALRFTLARGRQAREAMLARAAAAVAEGDFAVRLPLLARRESDLRPQWLAAQLRQVRERHLRVRRLVQSLRQTEPDAERRAALDRTLEEANGADRFEDVDARPLDCSPGPQADARWYGLWLGIAPWLPPALLATGSTPSAAAAWVAGLAVAAAMAWHLRARHARFARIEWRQWLPAAAFGVACAGPGVWLVATAWLQPAIAWPRSATGSVLALWVALGCVTALVAGLRRREHAHAA
jgi:hypothetical protein